MTDNSNNILSLNSQGAMDFFLKSNQYHSFELPEYFVFDPLLQRIRDIIADKPYDDCLRGDASPDDLTDVNFDILLNKDGRYAVRPLVLANPFLYYFLVRELCSAEAWPTVKALFEKFRVPGITSCALPVIPHKKEAFHKSTVIFNWWKAMEQRSVELSLEYRYMFVTDITNCYGSVNPQAFDWAFSLKGTKLETTEASPIAANLQRYLRALQHGRNVGIPQGSSIFDFIAEIVLGYSDLLLHEAIEKAGITAPYEIIRYRDDYRIFCNDRDALERISYTLQHVLESLNFRMNSKKTMISESIVTDAIKPDKLAYIYNTPIVNKKGTDFDSFEKHMLFILMFARKHPDSGSVRTLLSDLDKRVKEQLESNAFIPGGRVRAMAAICLQIALENVGSSHYALRIVSRMVDSLEQPDEKLYIIDTIRTRLISQPNSTYTQLWLQNMTYSHDIEQGSSPYGARLCRIAAGENVMLWNSSWLSHAILAQADPISIVDRDLLANAAPIITFRETRAYTAANDGDEEDEGEIIIEL